MPLKIEKRNGEIVTFDASRIRAAILKAGKATGEFGGRDTKWLTRRILKKTHKPGVDQTSKQSEPAKKCSWKDISKSIWCPG